MRFLLDTNIVSYWMRGDPQVRVKLQAMGPSELALSTITLAEIRYGIARSPFHKETRTKKLESLLTLIEVIPFDERASECYGPLRAELEARGEPISERDTQIAAIGLAHGLTVVTHNVREFQRVTGLEVEDWYC